MTHSGWLDYLCIISLIFVLIPLLLDDPLWALKTNFLNLQSFVLIPLLLDDPLWEIILNFFKFNVMVLIPLLLDDPLLAERFKYEACKLAES